MTKHTRFLFFTKTVIWLLVLIFGIGFLRLYVFEDIVEDIVGEYGVSLDPLYWIFSFIRTISIIGVVGILLYFVYTSLVYLSSRFYRESGIPLHEAYFHGYFDLAYVYERLKPYGHDTTYDTKTKSIIVKYDNDVFYILVRDIFGRLDGDPKSDTWYIVSKKRKQYGNIRYMKRRPIPNPITENMMYINKILKTDSQTVHNFVVITGLRHNTFQHEQINTVYEMEGILKQVY